MVSTTISETELQKRLENARTELHEIAPKVLDNPKFFYSRDDLTVGKLRQKTASTAPQNGSIQRAFA